MAVARVVTHYMLGPTRVYGFGYWTGLGTPDRIGFTWHKDRFLLTSGEQTQCADILSFVGSYLSTDENPTGRDLQQNAPCITTNSAGVTPTGVDNKSGESNGAVDKTLGVWTGGPGYVRIKVHAGSSPTSFFLRPSLWSKALAAFT